MKSTPVLQPDPEPLTDGIERREPPRALPALLTLAEVAEFLAVSEHTVRRLVRARKLPCLRIGIQLRFDRTDLLRWTSARKGG